ncbi:MAG: hypothetical protein LUE29_06555 [Lachnospiraceae bacterium]|nr:hypothetical protein [Lachnospiraceae bacterium]
MIYEEMEQLMEGLSYIEQDYAARYSESIIDKKLESFFACDDGQLNSLRGILLSTKYLYDCNRIALDSHHDQIFADVRDHTLHGKTLEDYEKMREEAIEKIKNTQDMLGKLRIVQKTGEELYEAAGMLAKLKRFELAVITYKDLDAAILMIKDGLSLTQIVRYLHTELLDTWRLLNEIGCPPKLSEEEKEQVGIEEEAERARNRFQIKFGDDEE